MRTKSRIVPIVLMLIISMMYSGCRHVKLAYEYDYRYIFHKINSLFDLNDQQADLCRHSIKMFHAWHRKSELPKYIECLNDIRYSVEKGFNPDQVDLAMRQMDQFKLSSIEKLIPTASTFLSTLSRAQIYKAERKILKKEKGNNIQGAVVSRAHIENIRKKTKARLQYILGRLTNEQLKMISEFALTSMDTYLIRLRHRNETHRFFFEQIIAENTVPTNIDLLRQVCIEAYGDNDPTYAKIRYQYRNLYRSLIMRIQESLTSGQKQYFLRQLKNLIRDLESLNRKGINQF